MTSDDAFHRLTPAEQKSVERRAKMFWVSLVVMLLGLQLVIGGFAVYLATSDPTVSVIPNYHQTALNWDQQKQTANAADRMGWTIELAASDVADAQGRRALEVAVKDENGNFVDDLDLRATAYHHAAANELRQFNVDSIGGGNYLVLAPLGRPGVWNVEIKIAGADQPITLQRTIEVIH